MGNPIFISYRRDDTEGEAGRLFDDLTREFGSNSVFMDVAGIRPGVDFVQAIEQNVADCGVLLAIIGPVWATITSASGQRRLDDPNDFVALEIASALKREVPVIPVLVHGAKMPSQDQLPESLKSFLPSQQRRVVACALALRRSAFDRGSEQLRRAQQGSRAGAGPRHRSGTTPRTASACDDCPAGGKEVVSSLNSWNRGPGGDCCRDRRLPGDEQAPAPPPIAGTTPAIVGTWKGTGAGHLEDTLNSLVISGSGNSLTMHAFGTCQPPPCDWGTQPAVVDGQSATATFHRSDEAGSTDTDRVASVSVTPNGGNLDVLVHNTFTEQGSSRSNQAHRTFVPGP